MKAEEEQQVYDRYLGAYTSTTSEERQQRLRAFVAEDVLSVLPNGEHEGFASLLQHVENFQKQRSGSYFEVVRFSAHHSQFLAELILHDRDGATAATAYTYGRFNGEGMLIHLTSFFFLTGTTEAHYDHGRNLCGYSN